jgi:NAD-dependent dihydropyrimidine dehydrogenase PreA subunit
MNKKKDKNRTKIKDSYLGIPRKEIPWFPSINYEKCDSCKTCVEFCKLETYTYNEEEDKIYVSNPYNCVVSCNGCESKCPKYAISFPSTKVIDKVRKKYGV